jgi:hypothetical protein
MTYEIHKPTSPTYFVFYGTEATHVGVTLPGEVTTTGQPQGIFDTDPAAWLAATVAINMPDLPGLPDEGQSVAINIYRYDGERVICHTEHTRTSNGPGEEPEHFTLLP